MPDRPDGRRPTRRSHAQIHLPALSAGYALTLVEIFERAIEAIWRAHGEEMAYLRDLREQHARARAVGIVLDGDPETPDDVDF